MKLLRRVIFWCHLAAGVTAGSIVLIMSVTGVLLTYERQIAAWSDTHAYRSGPESAGAARLSPAAILGAVQTSDPSLRLTSLTQSADPLAPASVLAGQRTLYVSPYTGKILGEPSPQPRAFFRKVTDWHRWLGVSGEGRATARMITGACNFAFLFLVVSGFYLWFPRKWNWRQFRAVLWFRGGLTWKAQDFNWHNVIGFWSAIPLVVVVASGVVMSYPWANNLVYRSVGEAPPAGRGGGPGPGGRGEAPPGGRGGGPGGPGESGGGRAEGGREARPAPSLDGIDALWARAEGQIAGWRTISMRLPGGPGAPVTFTIDQGDGGQPQKRSTLTLNAATGEVVRLENFSSLSAGRRLRSYLRFAHTGEVLGLFGQTIAGLVSGGGAVLVWTGLALALRRFLAWRKVRSSVLVTTAATPDAALGEQELS